MLSALNGSVTSFRHARAQRREMGSRQAAYIIPDAACCCSQLLRALILYTQKGLLKGLFVHCASKKNSANDGIKQGNRTTQALTNLTTERGLLRQENIYERRRKKRHHIPKRYGQMATAFHPPHEDITTTIHSQIRSFLTEK